MKRSIILVSALLVAINPSAFGLIILDTVETFSTDLGDWTTSGDVGHISTEGGFARIGLDRPGTPAAPVSILSNTFVIPSDGTYEFGFDFRFSGFDNSASLNDVATMSIIPGPTLGSRSSSTDLTGTFASRGSFNPFDDDVFLTTGIYTLQFQLLEAETGLISTEMDIDNVFIFSPEGPVIPAPGAMVLASIGVFMVGFLRNRRGLL